MLSLPKVSVIVPFRNEEGTLRDSLLSLVKQDYPGAIEILAVDDLSTDGSAEIVEEIMLQFPTIRLIRTDKAGEANSRNVAMRKATGEVFVNFSANAFAMRNFISVLISRLAHYGDHVAGVGCKHVQAEHVGGNSEAFGAAMRAALGGLGTSYHQPAAEQFTRSVAYTAYRAWIFDRVGLFDPSIPYGTDAEFNLRIARANYRLVYTPETAVAHQEVSSAKEFLRKMQRFGTARARIVRKHPWSLRPIHAAPSIGVVVATFLLFGALFDPRMLVAVAGLAIMYSTLCFLAAIRTLKDRGVAQLLRLTISFPLIHFGYGIGFLKGIILRGRMHS